MVTLEIASAPRIPDAVYGTEPSGQQEAGDHEDGAERAEHDGRRTVPPPRNARALTTMC